MVECLLRSICASAAYPSRSQSSFYSSTSLISYLDLDCSQLATSVTLGIWDDTSTVGVEGIELGGKLAADDIANSNCLRSNSTNPLRQATTFCRLKNKGQLV